MTAINFPNNPQNNDTYVVDNITYIYNSAINTWSFLPNPVDGYTGSQGDIGYTGSQGIPGESAAVGYTGSIGPIGYTGSAGEGFTGSIGYTGSAGEGFTGSQGDTGYTGSQGIIGYTGSAGTGGSGSSAPRFLSLIQEGNLRIIEGISRWYAPTSVTITKIIARVDEAPTGNNILLEINKVSSGVTTTINIGISAGTTKTENNSPNLSLNADDYLTVDVTQIGGTNPGRGLRVTFIYE